MGGKGARIFASIVLFALIVFTGFSALGGV